MLKEKADIRGGENLSIQGSTIQGKDVDLEAEKDIRLTAAENRSEMDIHEKTKNGGISTSWGIGGLSGVKVYGQSAKGMENAASLTHTASEVSAENTLHVSGGNDTIMTGSRMEGGKVVLATGGSLRIESLQDTESYKSRSNVKGGALASDVFKDSAGHKKLDKPYLSAETARGYTDSDYASVKEQAGIYAGQEGYDISVKDNTHLKGAVIDSKGSVDKNTLRTGTLSWEDIENKADYKSGGSGISYTAKLGGNVNKDIPSSKENSRYDKEPGTNTHNESDKVTETFDGNRIPLNERGLLGVPSAATKGKADSTTKAAMAPGKIIITDTKNQKQDVTGLDRNTRENLNQLKAIFDKTKAEERKQLVEEMSIVGNEAIHELAARNGWGEGSIEKTALHGLLGAMTSKAVGSSALAGILSGGVQEYAMGYMHNHMPKGWASNHPDEAQMIAAGLGMIVGSISNDKKIGEYIAQMGAKWNDENKIREIVQEKLSKSSNNEKYSGGEDTGGIPAFLLNLGVEVNADKYPWAYKFFKDGYMGSGREVDYSSDSEFASVLVQHPVMQKFIADQISDAEYLGGRSIDVAYKTLNFNGFGDLGNAIGKMDVTMHAERQEDGWHISISGGDVYDFDEHNYDKLMIDIANNLVWKEELEGRMVPYPWYVRIECDIS